MQLLRGQVILVPNISQLVICQEFCPVTVSFAGKDTLTCRACGVPFTAEIWLIIAADERPDLIAAVRNGTLHVCTCPHGHDNRLDAPPRPSSLTTEPVSAGAAVSPKPIIPPPMQIETMMRNVIRCRSSRSRNLLCQTGHAHNPDQRSVSVGGGIGCITG
ncbi:CpXC domain-containing protein [Chloroflexus sp.]|uniref:CpXC domain-containing protein n=1 Tax=Chloroflexus sp. TaxID=1904827 RepID=UPI0040492235